MGMKKEIYVPVTIEGKEVGCLKKLESLECHFEDQSNYMEYLKSWDETQSLRTYKISVGLLDYHHHCGKNKTIVSGNLSINRDGDFQDMFPNNIQQLVIDECDDATSLCDISSLIKYATELEVISIIRCNSMESLVPCSWFCSIPLPQPSPSYNGMFHGLKEFDCYGCKSMKKLFPLVLLPNLVNLEEIYVEECKKIEEIIGGTRSDEEENMGEERSSNNNKFNLPKLRSLKLRGLPKLKSICNAKLICDSLQKIEVKKCNSMEIVVPSSWSCPVNLEEIRVDGCEKMKEIIGGTRSDEEGLMGEENISSEYKFPKLRGLHLKNLPELKSICREKDKCDSLEEISVLYCQKLKRMPICLPLLENGRPSRPPSVKSIRIHSREWWESVVEWEHPDTKDVLRPLAKFWGC